MMLRFTGWAGLSVVLIWALVSCRQANADLVTIINSGFEDTSGQSVFNELTFGVPAGWTIYDPSTIVSSSGVFTGTLQPNGIDFFNGPAPEGDRVAILFNSTREGDGEYGIEQTLAATLEANTDYSLSVEVGNIASGVGTNGAFFNLDEFPGYRIDLMAGGEILAQDLNSLIIAEGEFSTSTVSFSTGATHARLGDQLGIRLVSLNEIPAGFTQMTSPDLEVDFDLVTLNATAVPEPSTFVCLSTIGLCFLLQRRKKAHPV